jgi:hypothetical protein
MNPGYKALEVFPEDGSGPRLREIEIMLKLIYYPKGACNARFEGFHQGM